MSIDLRGRVAVVTGSTGAVGSAVAARMRGLGASVFGVHSGRSAHPHDWSADLTDEQAVAGLFDEAQRRHGPVSIVVHTVGGFEAGGLLSATTLETWERMQGLNVRTTFLCLRESLRRLQGATYGRVIVFGAATAIDLPAGRSAYAISKASVHHLALVAAKEVAGTGVTVNALAPLIVDTPANRSWSAPDPLTWVTTDQICNVIEDLCNPASAANGEIVRLPRIT